MDSKKLKAILQQHKLWLESNGEDGKKAYLAGASLRGANFHGENLRGANLRDANLRDANFSNANISCADFNGANLMGADFRGANLAHVNLIRADLRMSLNILQWQAPVGIKRICYSVKHTDCVMHKLGCRWASTEESVKKIRKKYGKNSLYEKFLLMQVEALGEE